LKNYLADIYTIPANIGGYPAMNVPTGFVQKDGEQFAVGIQLMAPHWREDVLFGIGQCIEK
jgi:aspartyl-tRNA(Asn)/glutamyl-tRNA(Gln) amidotransferase subunit A